VFVIDDADVEGWFIAGAPEGFMPFAPDLGLVVEEDGVPIRLQARGVAFEVEVKLGEGDDMVFRPSGLGHVMQ